MSRKVNKSVAQRKKHEGIEEDQLSQARSNMAEQMQPTNMEQSREANLDIILKELGEFRRLKSETKKKGGH